MGNLAKKHGKKRSIHLIGKEQERGRVLTLDIVTVRPELQHLMASRSDRRAGR